MPLAAFLTGFLDEKANQITERKKKGEDYFEKQSERARKIANTQLEQRRERYRQLAMTGNTLINTANMPEHVLRGLVSAGPEAVNTALELFQKVPNHEWSADDWENIYSTSEFYAQEYNEDLNTFMQRTVGLIGDNYEATEQTGGDLQSAFAASALGYNAKDTARRRLNDVEVAPGMSASEALAMESRPGWQSDLDTTYSGPVPRAFNEIAGANKPPEELTSDDQWKWRGRFEEIREQEIEREAQRELARRRESGDPDLSIDIDAIMADPNIRMRGTSNAYDAFMATVPPEFASRLDILQNVAPQVEQYREQVNKAREQQMIQNAPQPTVSIEEPVAPTPPAAGVQPTPSQMPPQEPESARRGPFEALAERTRTRTEESNRRREEVGLPPPLTNQSIQEDLQRQSEDPEGRVRSTRGTSAPETNDPNALQRGWQAIMGLFRNQ